MSLNNTWHIKGKIDVKNPGHYETILTLSNGCLGMRGSYGFSAFSGEPGFYMAGLFNKTPYFNSELVNLPNPFNYSVVINDEAQNTENCRTASSEYELEMKRAVLRTKTVLVNKKGKRTLIEEERFLHGKIKQLAIISVSVTPLNYSSEALIINSFDLERAHTLVKGKKIYHLAQRAMEFSENGMYLETETTHTAVKTGQYLVFDASQKSAGEELTDENHISGIYEARLRRGRKYSFRIYSAHYTSRVSGDVERDSKKTVKAAVKKGYSAVLKEHAGAWAAAWKESDVIIKGDAYAQKITRYNIFNLLGLAPYMPGISIGAKGLHGEGYRGHAFWDTELFLLPFYMFTNPKAAFCLMQYRAERLGAAKEYAEKLGFKGARFPWESADTGEDVTPSDAHTVNQEHIISDISCAVERYIDATGDKVLISKLADIQAESARYYASRVEFDKKKNKYVMRKAIGPDEFHQDINNNFYTNYMVIKTMEAGIRAAAKFSDKASGREVKTWKKISKNIFLPFSSKAGFHEQFEGYFKLKDVKMRMDKNGNRFLSKYLMARYNSPEAPALFGKTQLIKQADAIMLYYLFFEDFPEEMIRKAYRFYEPRTTHGSSLSRCAYIITGARLGMVKQAYRDYMRSAELDLEDMKNRAGIHAASLGGVWKAIFYGFAGISAASSGISISPHLPKKWKSLAFNFKFRGSSIKCSITKERIFLKKVSGKPVKINYAGCRYLLKNTINIKY